MTKTKRSPQAHLHEARSLKKLIESKEIERDLEEEEEDQVIDFLSKRLENVEQ